MAAESRPALQALPAPGAGLISSVRLAAGPSLHLLMADDSGEGNVRRLLSMEVMPGAEGARSDGARPVAELRGGLDWDARLTAKGWQVVTLQAGSGVAPLRLLTPPDHRPRAVDAQSQLGIFSKPRFTGNDGSIIAIKVDGEERIVLYPSGADGGHAPRVLIDAAPAGRLQAVQRIAWRGGWLLAMQTFVPGPYRLQGTGATATVLRSGRLSLQPLSQDGEPIGAPWLPMGDRAIYEFAIAASTDAIGLLATTPDGLAFAQGVSDAQGRGLVAVEEHGLGELGSPCLQGHAGGWRVLVLRAAPDRPAQMLWADWPATAR